MNLDYILKDLLNKENISVESYSGGGTKASYFAGIGTNLRVNTKYKSDIVIGVSAGSLVAFPLVLGKYEKLKLATTLLELNDFFDKQPVNEEGKLTACSLYNITTTGSFGSMNNIDLLIRDFISEKEFCSYQEDETLATILVGIKSLSSIDRFCFINLKQCSYEEMVVAIKTSASIPLYTPPQLIDGEYYTDGGLRYHNAGRVVFSFLGERISRYISIYSRPQVDTTTDLKYDGKSGGRTVSKLVDSFNYAISKNDEEKEVDLNTIFKPKVFKQIFAPTILKGVYDVENSRLLKLYNAGLNQRIEF